MKCGSPASSATTTFVVTVTASQPGLVDFMVIGADHCAETLVWYCVFHSACSSGFHLSSSARNPFAFGPEPSTKL